MNTAQKIITEKTATIIMGMRGIFISTRHGFSFLSEENNIRAIIIDPKNNVAGVKNTALNNECVASEIHDIHNIQSIHPPEIVFLIAISFIISKVFI